MTDVCCTHSNVVNTSINTPNLINFLYDVEKLLPINPLKSELQIAVHFRMPVCQVKVGWQIVAESQQKLHTQPRNLQSYWVKVHQFFLHDVVASLPLLMHEFIW